MQVEHAYEVEPRALFGVLTDPTFLAARGARFGGTTPPTVHEDGGNTVVRTPRALPLDVVPGPLRRFAGDGTLVQVDEWAAVTGADVHGVWTADVGSVPMDLEGTHEITPHEGGCRYVVTARVKVNVPVVGRAAQKTVDEHLGTLVRTELEFLAEWLRSGAAHA
ncbi:MAG: DUF2505 domain-containing protein [Actinomycetes bacterium]